MWRCPDPRQRPAAPAGHRSRPERRSSAAARELIDRDGWEKLTIRRLAAEASASARPPSTTTFETKRTCCSSYSTNTPVRFRNPICPASLRIASSQRLSRSTKPLAAWPWAANSHLRRLRRPSRRVSPLDGREHRGRRFDYGCTSAQAVYVFRSIWYYTVAGSCPRPYRSAPGRRRATPPPRRLLRQHRRVAPTTLGCPRRPMARPRRGRHVPRRAPGLHRRTSHKPYRRPPSLRAQILSDTVRNAVA